MDMKQNAYYKKRRRSRKFDVGDKVPLLHPNFKQWDRYIVTSVERTAHMKLLTPFFLVYCKASFLVTRIKMDEEGSQRHKTRANFEFDWTVWVQTHRIQCVFVRIIWDTFIFSNCRHRITSRDLHLYYMASRHATLQYKVLFHSLITVWMIKTPNKRMHCVICKALLFLSNTHLTEWISM